MLAQKLWLGTGSCREVQHALDRAKCWCSITNQDSRSELQRILELLLDRIRLAVIFGGDKSTPGSVIYQSQNTRSWKSYEAVAEDIAASLRRCGFRNVELIPEDMSCRKRSAARISTWRG